MKIKVCGLNNKTDLLSLSQLNIDFFGFIFYEKSPRYFFDNPLDLNKNLNSVGVFVNESIKKVTNIVESLSLKYVQLHGSEDELYIKNLKKFGVKIIKTISVSNKDDLKKINSYQTADFFLFDYKPKKNELPGGNSKSFDWNILKSLKTDKPWFLSGGINLNNIQQILVDINPCGVDLSSGVEKELGIKDNHIINNFIDKLKNA